MSMQAVTPLPSAVTAALRSAAAEDQASVVTMAQRLVQTPSRGGIDPYDPVIDLVMSWLAENRLTARRLQGTGAIAVGLACDVPGGHPGPRYVLDACLDTAPFG